MESKGNIDKIFEVKDFFDLFLRNYFVIGSAFQSKYP